MAHIVHQRLLHAFSTLGKDVSGIALKMSLEAEELESLLHKESLIPFTVLSDICIASGVCRDYALLERGPMTPKVKSPLTASPGSESDNHKDQGTKGKESIELFQDRLNAVLDLLPLTDTEIGAAIDTSKQSVGRWRRNGMISKDNLKALCAIEDLDYDWVVTGVIDSEEAQATHDRVFGTKLSQIDKEIARLQAQRKAIADSD